MAIVDDLRINREGTRAILEGLAGVEVVAALDFEQALCFPSWASIDWVVIDVAQETRDDDQTPSVPVIERIRSMHPAGRPPQVVAVTANPVAYNEPLIRLRLVQADPDVALLWRRDLEELVDRAASGSLLGEDLMRAPAPETLRTHPELGITPRTLLNRVHDGARQVERAAEGRWTERQTLRLRAEVARASNLEPVNQDGTLSRNSETPSVRQFRRILARLQLGDRGGT